MRIIYLTFDFAPGPTLIFEDYLFILFFFIRADIVLMQPLKKNRKRSSYCHTKSMYFVLGSISGCFQKGKLDPTIFIATDEPIPEYLSI